MQVPYLLSIIAGSQGPVARREDTKVLIAAVGTVLVKVTHQGEGNASTVITEEPRDTSGRLVVVTDTAALRASVLDGDLTVHLTAQKVVHESVVMTFHLSWSVR